MGMFDFNPADVRVATSEGYTNAPMLGAFAGYGGMLQGIGKLAGFQDEEDLLKEIYDTSDFATKEGRAEAIARVRQVNPEKAAELSRQILEQEQTEANIVNTEIQVENAKIERAQTIYGPALVRKFETDVSVDGQRAAIHTFLTQERIKFNPKKVLTMMDAIKVIENEIGDNGDGKYVSGLEEYVNSKKDFYVKRGVYEKAGLVLDTSEDVAVPTSTERADLIDTPAPSAVPEYLKGEVKAEDSDFTRDYKRKKAQNEIKVVLSFVKNSLIDLMPEMFMSQTDKNYENAEDAVSEWVNAGMGMVGESQAEQWFLTQPPEELEKFKSNPVEYYKKNRAKIEGSVTYDGANNADLFASIPYDLDS
jgi:hypothetical protein